MLKTLATSLQSRTIVTLAVLLAVINVPEVQAYLPKGQIDLITNLLIVIAGYFRVNAVAKL